MQTEQVLLASVAAAIVLAVLLWWLLRATLRSMPRAPGLEAELAVARERAARLTEAERQFVEATEAAARQREARMEAETALAVACEAAARGDAAAAELRARHASAEAELAALRAARAAAEEALAGRKEALAAAEQRNGELEGRLERLAAEFAGAQEAAALLRTENAGLRENLENERRQAEEKLMLLRTARAEMTAEFKLLADEVMTRHGETFTRLNRTQIDGVLAPLKEKLGEFEAKVQASQVESTKERATLGEQIRQIAEASSALRSEAKDLADALRGRRQLQGAWGEMVLATILERSGLRAGEEYQLQQSFADEEGARLRPDVLVNLPGGQHVVVDAKVSLSAYEVLCSEAADEPTRRDALARHLLSIRTHITQLGAKDYQAATNSGLDYVFMFVPIEGALAAAVAADPNLIGFALEKNVTLVTPTTLMIALRTVRSVWQVERRNRNAEEIAERAGRLYDKFVGFVSDMQGVGDNLGRARKAWDLAMGKLATGPGNVVRQLEQLKAMGARTGKSLPETLLAAAEGEVRLVHDGELPEVRP